MENYDPEKAARVWQRVRGNGEEDDFIQALPGLIAGEWRAAATYLALSRRSGGQDKRLRRLFEEEQAHAACLKGIYTLAAGRRPVITTLPPVQEPPEMVLRRCYGDAMRALAEYERRSDNPEYGPVFRRLAEQEREHCKTILELIGLAVTRAGSG